MVAMLAAVNSKREKYRPAKWMANGKALMRQSETRRREPMTGEEVMARFRQLGVRVIDMRRQAE